MSTRTKDRKFHAAARLVVAGKRKNCGNSVAERSATWPSAAGAQGAQRCATRWTLGVSPLGRCPR
eukprot:733864-Alexandrium_andersonii.AAC.1